MIRFSVALAFALVSGCMVGEIDNAGAPSNGGSSNGGSGDGGSGDGGSSAGPSAPLAATIADVAVVPGDTAIVTVTLNRAPTSNLSFTYTTADGTALAGTNYTGVTSGSAMIAQGKLSTEVAIATSSTPGTLYLGKRFAVALAFATEPTLNHTATVSFSAAPRSTGTRVLKNKWAAFPAGPTTPAARVGHSAIWTGKKLIIWGGMSGTSVPYSYYGGAAYDPETNNWAPISSAGAPIARTMHVAVWTGTKMIVWGGYNDTAPFYRNDGGVYDPATDTWAALPQNGAIPSSRQGAVGVWTGTKMIVWGGGPPPFLNNGAAYDPGTGTWVAIATANAPSPRMGATAVWTGTKMLVWSGTYAARPVIDGVYNFYNDGAAYDPATNTWTPMSSAGAPTARFYSTAAWTGTQMITWDGATFPPGGAFVLDGNGGIYDPAANGWSAMSVSSAPSNRAHGASVWTGSSFIYWGGGSTIYLNDGGIYY